MTRGRRVALVLFAVAAAVAVLCFPTSPARDDVRWTGTVRLLGGGAARGPGIVRLYGKGGQDAAIAVPYDPQGRFDVRLAPGTYGALLEPPGEHREPVALPETARIGAADVSRDLRFPAGTVRGTVLDARTGRPAVSWRGRVALSHIGDVLLLTQTVELDDDGTFHVDAVQPGRYALDHSSEPVIAEVSAATPDVVVELRIYP